MQQPHTGPAGMILEDIVEGDDSAMRLLPMKVSQWEKTWMDNSDMLS